jgi:hypothetical protein
VIFITAHSLLRVLHHGSSTSSLDARRGLSPSTQTPSGDCRLHPIVVIREQQVMYDFFPPIMSYILNMLICVGMILLDNLLQCLLFIAMIDLSRTCGTTASLICNALLMFMIYSWIKIKLKVLICPTIQKPYCRHLILWLDLLML